MEKKVRIRIDDSVYQYLEENGADLQKIMQLFANQLNYYLNEQINIYRYIRDIETSHVFYRIAEELREAEEAKNGKKYINQGTGSDSKDL